MGSFNMTCGVSQQTIAPGDPCYVMAILQRADSDLVQIAQEKQSKKVTEFPSMTCHYDGFWRPVGNFIRGKYDDYGQIALELDDLNRNKLLHLFKELQGRAWNTKQGSNQYHDLPFNFTTFLKKVTPTLLAVLEGPESEPNTAALDSDIQKCWEYVWEVARKGRLFLNDSMHVPRPLEFAMVHAATYDALVSVTAAGKSWQGGSMEMDTYLRKNVKEALAGAKKDPDMRGYDIANHLREAFRFIDGGGLPLTDLLNRDLMAIGYRIADKRITSDQALQIFAQVMPDRYALGGYTALNARLMPAPTASQDYCNDVGQAFAALVAKVSSQVSRMRQEKAYAPFLPYYMQANNRTDLQKLAAYLRQEVDGAIDYLEIFTQENGVLQVNFDSTLDEAMLRKAIKSVFDKEAELMHSTLRIRVLSQ